eukprot:6106461-Pyramimonas_sp.AAC.1
MRLKSCTVAVGVIYLVPSVGASGINSDRLRGVAEFVRGLSIPWLLMGDFNMSVDFLGDAGILELLGARPLVPSNVEFTCAV